MTEHDPVLAWLLDGDPAIRWQTFRDLLGRSGEDLKAEQTRVARAGWGRRILELQAADGRWGGGLYTPKWTSTTYTLLLLRAFGLSGGNRKARTGASQLLDAGLYCDNGINFWAPGRKSSETCVTGMALAVASRFAANDPRIERLAGHLLEHQMPDGGWNCRRPRGATHSSLHTTISVLRGSPRYEQKAPQEEWPPKRGGHARGLMNSCTVHRMFRSHRGGEVIDEQGIRGFPFPPQWPSTSCAARTTFRPRVPGAITVFSKRSTCS